MDEQAGRSRFQVPWSELESAAHVPVDQQVEMQDVAVHEPIVPPEELDRQKAMGTVGDFRLSR
jgi:hypothetical protein